MEKRLGFHYFQDTHHFQEKDLNLWLPELTSLNAGWIVLKSSSTAAIPEEFIDGLVSAGIQPIIHFDFQVNSTVKPDDIRILLSAYARWGAKYVMFFDKPNTKSAWLSGTWSQGDLVERFLDRYLPFVQAAEQNGLVPVFPPLQPGGDYWDLSFLKKVLQVAQQRRSIDFSANLHMAVSAQTFDHPLEWGIGGSARWKTPRPYTKTEIGEEDHMGFNTWQWYADLVKDQLNTTAKMFLLYLGASNAALNKLDTQLSFESLVDIAIGTEPGALVSLPGNVLGCMFSLMNGSEADPLGTQVVAANQKSPQAQAMSSYKEKLEQTRKQSVEYPVADKLAEWIYPIDHYLLLPSYEWGIPENTLDRVRPIIRDARPTIGFSVIEATNARKVTVWNENAAFNEKDIQLLREAGCQVDEQIINSIGIAV